MPAICRRTGRALSTSCVLPPGTFLVGHGGERYSLGNTLSCEGPSWNCAATRAGTGGPGLGLRRPLAASFGLAGSNLRLSSASWGPVSASLPRPGPASSWEVRARRRRLNPSAVFPQESAAPYPFGMVFLAPPSLLRSSEAWRHWGGSGAGTPLLTSVLPLTGELLTSSPCGHPRPSGGSRAFIYDMQTLDKVGSLVWCLCGGEKVTLAGCMSTGAHSPRPL